VNLLNSGMITLGAMAIKNNCQPTNTPQAQLVHPLTHMMNCLTLNLNNQPLNHQMIHQMYLIKNMNDHL
jgi:hypothetical protein